MASELCQYLAASQTTPVAAADFAGRESSERSMLQWASGAHGRVEVRETLAGSFKCPSGESEASLIIQPLPPLLYFARIRDKGQASVFLHSNEWKLKVNCINSEGMERKYNLLIGQNLFCFVYF